MWDEVSKGRAGVILWVLCECLRMAAIDLLCFMPGAMGRILDMLGVGDGERDFAHRAKRLPRGGEEIGGAGGGLSEVGEGGGGEIKTGGLF